MQTMKADSLRKLCCTGRQEMATLSGVNRARPRVLIAGTPQALQVLGSLLRGDSDILCARSVKEALRLVDSSVDLIICNIRFDESRMFDFLHELQQRPWVEKIPVICCRIHGYPIPLASKHAIGLALVALGVATFVDLAQFRADHGESADNMFRTMVLGCLNQP